MKIYRNFDRAELDVAYNAAKYVEDVAQYFEDYNAKSDATRTLLGGSFDVSFGPSTAETLDIFFPARRGDAPIHVFFHGGGYRSQDKWNFSFIAEPLVKAGAIVVIPNYGLCPAVRLDEIIRQVRAGIAWVYANARTMGGDPNAISISGHSSGAHAVAMALETDWSAYGRTPDDVVKSAIAISGLYDQEPRRLSYLNDFLHLDREESLRHSCIFRTPRRRVPFLLTVGGLETSEYIRQTEDYVSALTSRSYATTYLLVPERNHYDILSSFVDQEHPLGRAWRSFAVDSFE